jgi:N-acetylglucosaminyldiphosphoundecaprenol N-acetyl-beta-D-mannosaminyltransferase
MLCYKGMAVNSLMKVMSTNCFSIFGFSFCAAPKNAILSHIRAMAASNRASSVIFANAHVVVEAHRNPRLRNALNSASLVIPDGVPITWVLKAKGQKDAERYSGPDLMQDLFHGGDGSHFFLGSTPATLDGIRRKFKGNAVGFYSPPFSNNGFSKEELSKQLEMIEKAKPDFVWVGLGGAKQEYYVTHMASKAAGGVWLGVGAAFDFYAGPKPRAPKFLQRMGLEWAFRLAVEPRRLARRYLTTNPAFVKLALLELLSDRIDPESAPQGRPASDEASSQA